MAAYREAVHMLSMTLAKVESRLPRHNNTLADALARLASSLTKQSSRAIFSEYLKNSSIVDTT